MDKKKIAVYVIIATVIVIAGAYFFSSGNQGSGRLDQFAICLKDRGAVFYGAFWCPHCQNQKAMFGKSAKLLPYVECSEPSGQGQLPICNEKGVTGYPTWVYPDGSRESGEISLTRLAEKTGCELPK